MNSVLIQMKLKELIKEVVFESFACELSFDDIELNIPQEISHGHYTTNCALKNSKLLEKKPFEIAEVIKDKLLDFEYIANIEIKGPGFINFYLQDIYFDEALKAILNDEYMVVEKTKQKVNVEYVSTNPTGELHLGHARNAIFGSSLVNILRLAGDDVSTEYYVNDAGQQMINLALSIKYFYNKLLGIADVLPEDGYHGQDVQNIAQDIFDSFGDSKKDAELDYFREYGLHHNIEEIKRILHQLKVEFDEWKYESFYYETGLVGQSLKWLEDDIYEKDDAVWLETEKYGDDKDRVLQKKDGSYTYFTSDIAYHFDKYNRGDYLINIWGGDHHGYVKRIEAAMQSMGKDSSTLKCILLQMVNLYEGEEKVKMSKRAGTSVTIRELIDLIGIDEIRYFFVVRSADSQLDFDLEKAKKTNTENPIYYIQYASARISSILQTAQEKNIIIKPEISQLSGLEKELINKLSEFNEVVLESANKLAPHMIANYLYEVATLYHKYYNQEKIFGIEQSLQNSKLFICECVKIIIGKSLDLIGIEAKSKM